MLVAAKIAVASNVVRKMAKNVLFPISGIKGMMGCFKFSPFFELAFAMRFRA